MRVKEGKKTRDPTHSEQSNSAHLSMNFRPEEQRVCIVFCHLHNFSGFEKHSTAFFAVFVASYFSDKNFFAISLPVFLDILSKQFLHELIQTNYTRDFNEMCCCKLSRTEKSGLVTFVSENSTPSYVRKGVGVCGVHEFSRETEFQIGNTSVIREWIVVFVLFTLAKPLRIWLRFSSEVHEWARGVTDN